MSAGPRPSPLPSPQPAPRRGTLDLVPRLRPLLGLSACQPPSEGPWDCWGQTKNVVPRPMGTRGRALSGPVAPRRPPPWRSLSIHWNRSQASLRCLGLPRDAIPSGGQEHYTAQEAFTLDGGPAPPTPLQRVGPPASRPPGPTHMPASWEGPGPVSGNCPPGGGAGKRGGAGREPALAVTST